MVAVEARVGLGLGSEFGLGLRLGLGMGFEFGFGFGFTPPGPRLRCPKYLALCVAVHPLPRQLRP